MTFEFDGKKYDKVSSHQQEWGEKVIAELKIKGNEHILDLGCGAGALTELLAQQVPEGSVTGIDGSNGMLETARKRKSSNLHFEQMDINELAFDKKFDIIFSNAALHWIKDHQRLLENVSSLLKNNGVIRFNFAMDGNCPNLIAITKKLITTPEFAEYFANFNWPWFMPRIDEYQNLLDSFSFLQSKLWSEDINQHFIDAEAMIGWIDQPCLVPFVENINDSAAKKSFRDQVIEYMVKTNAQTDGSFQTQFHRLNIFARK